MNATIPGYPEGISVVRNSQEMSLPRCLLISSAFPPSSVVGALRWEKLAGYLHDAGFALDVVTTGVDETESLDLTRLDGLPRSTRVFGVARVPSMLLRLLNAVHITWARLRVGEEQANPRDSTRRDAAVQSTLVRTTELERYPRTLQEWQRAYRGRLAREQESAWTGAAQRAASVLSKTTRYHAVFSSGPPNLCHQAAAIVAHQSCRPFIMDMRDPWGTAVAVVADSASALEIRFARRTEAKCVRTAAAVVVNTGLARELLIRRYPGIASRCCVVMNGTDGDAPMELGARDRFTIVFAGSIYFDRNPRMVFRAAAQVIDRMALTPADFGFNFIGSASSYGGITTKQIAEEEGIGEYVETTPFIPRGELLKTLASASVLLSLPQDVETSIPAKIFEYMSFPAWLLVIAAQGSATAQLLVGTDADVVEPSDVSAMTDRIARRVQEFRAGVTARPVGASGQFGRAEQARVLIGVLRGISPADPAANG